MTGPSEDSHPASRRSLFARLRERGVLRVAASYAVIAWLALQIADVVLDPLGLPEWVMTTLILAAVAGFPVALILAWFLEMGPQGVEVDTAPPGARRPSVPGLRHYADAIVIGILLVTVAILAVRESGLGRPKPPQNPAIAVLPFENLSGDPRQEYFSDGLAQEVLDRLSRVPGLTVISRASSFSFKGSGLDPRAIAERLGVTSLLLGSVRRDGDRVKLSAELIDGATGRQLWSGTFDRKMSDIFRLQEELAAAVIDGIIPTSLGAAAQPSSAPTSDLKAYDLYLLGRAAQESRFGERMREAVSNLEQATRMDPGFAKAYAALSRALILWTFYPFVAAPPDAMRRAEAAAHRALALDPDSSDGHAALGTVLRSAGNRAAAAEQYESALASNPNNAVALWDYAVFLDQDRATKQHAAQLLERLARLDPRSPMLWQSRVLEAAEQGDAGRVASLTEQAIEMLPDDADGLRLLFFAARSEGYAPEALRLNIAFARTGPAREALFLSVRTWLLVDDLARAWASATQLEQLGDEKSARLARYLLAEIAGLKGDFAAWDRLIAQGSIEDVSIAASQIFWLAVQERYPEAARKMADVGPLPDRGVGGLGSSLAGGQLLPAVLRIYRATGRSQEADALAKEYLERLRKDPTDRLALAELDANEGLDDEAVRILAELFEQYPLVEWFHPELPWFRHLEGRPDYDLLLAERRRRIEQAHAEMLQLETQATGTVLDPEASQ